MPAQDPDVAERLIDLAVSRPREALEGARAVLAGEPTDYAAAVAHQAAGIVHRDLGDTAAAVRELRAAIRLARRAGRRDRECDVLASLGVALALGGRTSASLAAFEQALRHPDAALVGRVLSRRGGVLVLLGRNREAVEDLDRAVASLASAGDAVWTGRALLNRSMAHVSLGHSAEAGADARSAEAAFAGAGQDLEGARAVHNRGLVAQLAGDLPGALSLLAEAERRYSALGVPVPDLAVERSAVLLAAGLAPDALHELETAIAGTAQTAPRAELLLAAAGAAAAAGDFPTALLHARAAGRLFRAQRRGWWAARAALVAAEARTSMGPPTVPLLRAVETLAGQLDDLAAEEGSLAHLLAGRIATALGDRAAADRHLRSAAGHRHRGPALVRASGWLAAALAAGNAGRPRSVMHACGRGLDALDDHRRTLGGSELRALSTGHGRELAAIALREALRRGDPAALLRWSERWRATALAVVPVRPPDDDELASDLAALRNATRRLQDERADGAPSAAAERDRARWEAAVRNRQLHLAGTGAAEEPFDLAAVLDELADTRLVELVAVDGTLHAVVGAAGRLRRFPVGSLARAEREVEFARFALRRAAHGLPADLSVPAGRLQEALLGPVAGALGEEPVVVVPPGRLHAVPWALLPALADRPLSVAPSAALWLRAARAPVPAHRRVALAVGPGLDGAGAEITQLAAGNPAATVLRGADATAERVLHSLDGAWLAHVAAHGTFRADSPLFSCLELADGPLTVHDLERLRRAPYRLLLSACDSGVGAPVGADELLGLGSGLIGLGTAGVLASVVAVNDTATTTLACAVHAALHAGRPLAAALLEARRRTAGDPVGVATGGSFVALGV